MSQRVSTRHIVLVAVRKKAAALGAAALVLLGFGIMLNRATLGNGPETAAPSLAQAGSVRIPDVTGLPLSSAVVALARMGLRVNERDLTARIDPLESGRVLFQEDTVAGVGETVPLVLSAGPDPHVQVLGGERRVFVGGTCELETGQLICVGGPLYVALDVGHS
jgi:hypothetical protein